MVDTTAHKEEVEPGILGQTGPLGLILATKMLYFTYEAVKQRTVATEVFAAVTSNGTQKTITASFYL
jgi:hypothetical protein